MSLYSTIKPPFARLLLRIYLFYCGFTAVLLQISWQRLSLSSGLREQERESERESERLRDRARAGARVRKSERGRERERESARERESERARERESERKTYTEGVHREEVSYLPN